MFSPAGLSRAWPSLSQGLGFLTWKVPPKPQHWLEWPFLGDGVGPGPQGPPPSRACWLSPYETPGPHPSQALGPSHPILSSHHTAALEFTSPGSARGVCTCFRCYTWSTYRISISFHLQNTKSNPSECPELFLSTRLCCQSDTLHGIWAIFQRIWSDWEPGQTWKDVSDSLAKLLFCRKVIKSQSNKITSSSLHNELFQIKQNEVLLSARPWTVSSILQCFSVNCSVITSWLYRWLK